MKCNLDGTDTQAIKVVNRLGIPETMLRVFVSTFSAFKLGLYPPKSAQCANNHQEQAPAYQLSGKVYAGADLLC